MSTRFVDLSHDIVDGMTTHPGIAPPVISTVLSFEDSAARYAPGTVFEIRKIDMVANTGTYLDMPAHRFPGGADLAALELSRVADVPGICVDVREAVRMARAIDARAFDDVALDGMAVLIRTGWDRHWGTREYLAGHPFLTAEAAALLVERGATLVGIDSLNVDSLEDPSRPAHTAILAAGLPLLEHLTGLDALPANGFRVFAVPPRVRGMGTFPVRAFAIVE
jgi:kynurenine formamidase